MFYELVFLFLLKSYSIYVISIILILILDARLLCYQYLLNLTMALPPIVR
jgi:hypothetical protein